MPKFILSDNDVNNIIELYKSGFKSPEIAKRYGVGCTTITRALKRNNIELTGVKIELDSSEIVRLYESGVSENAIAGQFSVSRSVIRRRLIESNVVIRGQKAANQLMMENRTPEEHMRNVANAHEAIKGKRYTHEELCQRAISRQNSFSEFSSDYEFAIADELSERGIKFTPQYAIDKYNVDFAIFDNIALEVYGGGWHAGGRAARRFDTRSKKIFDSGYTLVLCWAVARFNFVPSRIVDYLISLNDILSSDPSFGCKHYVIRGDGKPTSLGSSNLDYIT